MALQHLLRFVEGEVDDVDPAVGMLFDRLAKITSKRRHSSSVNHDAGRKQPTPPPSPRVAEGEKFLTFKLHRDPSVGFGLVLRSVQFNVSMQDEAIASNTGGHDKLGSSFLAVVQLLWVRFLSHSECCVVISWSCCSGTFGQGRDGQPSPAVAAGVHVNDLILSCNGSRVCDFDDLAEAFEQSNVAVLSVFRGFYFTSPEDEEWLS